MTSGTAESNISGFNNNIKKKKIKETNKAVIINWQPAG